MQDLIQPDHLPVEFGGRGPTIPDIIGESKVLILSKVWSQMHFLFVKDDWKDRMVRAAGWFVDEDKHGPFSGWQLCVKPSYSRSEKFLHISIHTVQIFSI